MTQRQSNIFLVLSILMLATGYAAWKYAALGEHIPLVDLTQSCAGTKPVTREDNSVILRLDDVQSYHLTDVSLRMMQDAIDRDLPIVAGVIPKGISGEPRIIEFLQKNSCMIEVAIHGLDHKPVIVDGAERGEYAFLSYEDARVRTEEALDELRSASKQQPTSFIPPYNELSLDSRTALADLGVPIVSALGTSTYDFDAGTWDFDTDEFVTADKVLEDCFLKFANDEKLCVVMLHPQDYINPDNLVDEGRYAEYIKLLDELKAHDGLQVTRFDTHYKSFNEE